MQELLTLLVNNGTAVVVLAYFLWRDYQFTRRLDTTLATLQKSTNNIEIMLKERRDKNDHS